MKKQFLEIFIDFVSKTKIILIMVIFISFLCGCTNMSATSNEEERVYNCDVKHLKFSTTIEISKDGEKWGEVKGNIFSLIEDPLTLYDASGKRIGYAGDTYKFIAQDSHGLYLNNMFKYNMVGQFDILGESYKLYDANEEIVAVAFFDMSSTSGTLVDEAGNLIAIYESGLLSSDFNVIINNNCNIEDEVIIMLFSSYYSDYNYDNNK